VANARYTLGKRELARKNRSVVIQRRGTAQGTTGQVIESWTTTATVFASISPISGREYFNASGERAEVTHRVVIRYGPSVAARDRIVYGSRVFDIKSVIDMEEKNRQLVLMCTEHT
jgi:SPP1 family predicted phage head-tail adaptor